MAENDYQNQSRPLAWVRAGLVIGLTLGFVPRATADSRGDDATQSHAQQIVALLDYVAADYPRAVSDDGKILIDSEFAEQKGLLEDAAELAADLPSGNADLSRSIASLQAQAAHVVPGAELAASIATLRGIVIQRFAIASAPAHPPSRERGAQLYAVACAACHGLDGRAATDAAAQLDPKPAMFTDAARMAKLSPFRAYNAVTFGVQGTSMAAFDTLSDADRWDLATYLFTLRDAQADPLQGKAAATQAGVSLDARQLATLTDGELLGRLGQGGVSGTAGEQALAFLRSTSAYQAAGSGDLGAVRRSFDLATARYRAGDRGEARRSLLSAYLDGFEPKEPALRARNADLVSEVEDAFVRLRGAVEAGASADEVESKAARVDALLDRIDDSGHQRGGAQVAFWGALLIILREGLEAALLVSALLAILRCAGRSSQANAVHAGWALAVALGVFVWFASGRALEQIGASREVVEGVVQLLTAALLFYASHWLLARAHGKRWVSFLKEQAPGRTGAWSVLGLAFLAVFRELLEVVVFFRGLQIETGGATLWLWAGGLTGGALLAVAVLGFLRLGRNLPIRPFLLGCGGIMCALSVVMVGHGVRALQEAGWIRLTPLGFQSVDLIGLYNSTQGLLAQGVLILALLASAVWVWVAANQPSGDVPGPHEPRPAAS